MSLHANRVQMTVTGTPGTGTITLNAATSGYQSFGTAYSSADATVDILITEGTSWEVARNCTYTHSGTTVTRGTLEASSSGSAVSFTSAAIVSVIATADFGNRAENTFQSLIPGGRLTLESGVPVSTSDQTGKTTIYYTPYVHNVITLWDGGQWVPTTFTETSLALGTLTSGLPYDVFAYLSSGALALELLAWTDDTTRATTVTLQDGRYCKNGDKTRLLLGSFYTTSTTETEDSEKARYVDNVYNAVTRYCFASNSTSHTYTTASAREWNNSSTLGSSRFGFISSALAKTVSASIVAQMNATSGTVLGYASMGINSTSPLTIYLMSGNAMSNLRAGAATHVQSVIGANYVCATQLGSSNVTYQGMQLRGEVSC
jgi:hypothetical protein